MELQFEQKITATMVIGVIGVLLTIARRYKNNDKSAGLGVAGWIVFILFNIWT